MAEEVEDERWAHIRGVTVTTIASLFGVLAALASSVIITGPDDTIGVALFAIAVVIQFPILRVIGIKVEDFGIKDYLFITFMTFAFWFMTLTILLTTEAELPI